MKPSEKTPLTMQRVAALIEERASAGGAQVTHGGQAAVEALLDHPDVAAVSFVGSSPVARVVYARPRGTGAGPVPGRAKNPVVVLEDADVEAAVSTVARAPSGARGSGVSRPRWRSPSAMPTRRSASGSARWPRAGWWVRARRSGAHGPGDPGREPGADRAADRVAVEEENARAVVDGRGVRVPGHEDGFFVRPTVLDELPRRERSPAPRSSGRCSASSGGQRGGRDRLREQRRLRNMAASSRTTAGPRAASATRSSPGTWGSTSAWPLRWRSSRSAAGGAASSATCTPRAPTRSSSTRRPRSSWSAGPGRLEALLTADPRAGGGSAGWSAASGSRRSGRCSF